jgi:hypothetical protein
LTVAADVDDTEEALADLEAELSGDDTADAGELERELRERVAVRRAADRGFEEGLLRCPVGDARVERAE